MVISCPLCGGDGIWIGESCPLCGGDGGVDLTDSAVLKLPEGVRILTEYVIRDTLLNEVVDIKDKCNDIEEKVDEIMAKLNE